MTAYHVQYWSPAEEEFVSFDLDEHAATLLDDFEAVGRFTVQLFDGQEVPLPAIALQPTSR